MKKLIFLPLFFLTFFCSAQTAQEIIGKPIKFKNLLVAEYDFPSPMNWQDAKKACASLGKGWRLPTQKELQSIYANWTKFKEIKNEYYWSSTIFLSKNLGETMAVDFTDGFVQNFLIEDELYVRAVKINITR